MTHKEVTDRLRSGQSLVVGINYGTLNDLMPALSGSKTFRGGHFIMLGGYAGPDVPDKDGFRPREEWTRLGDPLHDGRQSYPKGWQTVRVRRYLRAAETFGAAGKGRAKVLALRKAKER
jgi:hypothetical protein